MAGPASSTDAAHIADLPTGEEVPLDDLPGGEGEAVAHAPTQLSKDAFYGMFKMAFHMPNAVLAGRGPFPIESLPIRPDEEQAARAASDAIYEIAEETPGLRWLIAVDSPWLQRAIPIAVFFAMKGGAVTNEIRAKRARNVSPEPATEATGIEPETEPRPAPERAVEDYPKEI